MPASVLEELFSRGAHYGCSRRRRHPSVNPYLYGFKNRTAIIDLEKSLAALTRAEDFFRAAGEQRKTVLLVGTKPEARAAVTAAGARLGLPYVAGRWIGGTLTNFTEIKKRLARLDELKKQFVSGGLEKNYTKQERGQFQKELDRLKRSFTTIAGLSSLPAALLVVDSAVEQIAVEEARSLSLPVVSLSGADCDIRWLDYPIIVNDASVQSIEWIIGRLADAYEAGAALGQAVAVEPVPITDDQHQAN
ncbi:MAG: 30S ribosomal protein S2 [Candidatus Vogelbacteria bacterium]|nr:30S ribosomal protein S2 [Candidatus Vogelbacteria bacterium]